MSTEGETLQVSVLPYRCSICPPLVSLSVVAQPSSEVPDGLMNYHAHVKVLNLYPANVENMVSS